jgi:hypothetical protein
VEDEEENEDAAAYAYFSFISDRKKGLIDAQKEVFPQNHASYCAVHIARNAQVKYGKENAKYILPLAKTFSFGMADMYLERMSGEARGYVAKIPPSQWRYTAWLENPNLPPRFGIVTPMFLSHQTLCSKEEGTDRGYTVLTKCCSKVQNVG